MGKGTGWRKGTNYKAYNDADYWTLLAERKAKEKADLAEKEEKKHTEEKE